MKLFYCTKQSFYKNEYLFNPTVNKLENSCIENLTELKAFLAFLKDIRRLNTTQVQLNPVKDLAVKMNTIWIIHYLVLNVL